MEMTRFEKSFVNREKKAKQNILLTQDLLNQIEALNIQNALEIGCGIGSVSGFLSKNYEMNVMGVDSDPQQVDLALAMQAKNDRLNFKQADATQLEFADESFDIVIAQNIFHHIPRWKVTVKEISRVLKPHAFLIWVDFTLTRIVKRFCQLFVKNYGLLQ